MKVKKETFERIYQRADGTYLPDTSQPNPDAGFAIMAEQYTPHQSTRYMNVAVGLNGKAQSRDKKEFLQTVIGISRNCIRTEASVTAAVPVMPFVLRERLI